MVQPGQEGCWRALRRVQSNPLTPACRVTEGRSARLHWAPRNMGCSRESVTPRATRCTPARTVMSWKQLPCSSRLGLQVAGMWGPRASPTAYQRAATTCPELGQPARSPRPSAWISSPGASGGEPQRVGWVHQRKGVQHPRPDHVLQRPCPQPHPCTPPHAPLTVPRRFSGPESLLQINNADLHPLYR